MIWNFISEQFFFVFIFCEKAGFGDKVSWDLSLQVKDHVVREPCCNCLHGVHTAMPIKQLTSDKWCNVSSKAFLLV